MQLCPVILCGGSGTRLWPLSRGSYPKQFMDIGGETLFGRTLERAAGVAKRDKIVVVCNEDHRFFAAGIAHSLQISVEILLEPQGRNTAPAIALAALHLLDINTDPVLLVMPSDHKIEPRAAFYESVQKGMTVLENDPDRLMTFGISATRPETGFGYLVPGEKLGEAGIAVKSFIEKPDSFYAQKLLDAGAFWNGGLFLFRAQTYLEALHRFAPDIAQACAQAWQKRSQDIDFIRPEKQAFLSSPTNSIDYAVMEHAEKVAMVALEATWSDLGSWESFYTAMPHDSAGNAIQGDVLVQESTDCYLHATHRLLAVLGVHNLAVVETADAVLVVDRTRTQDVKSLLATLKASGRSEADTHLRVFRPWGTYELITLSNRYQVKKITVRPGAALSLQLHYHRAEHWIFVSGTAKVTIDETEYLVTENQSVYIPLGTKHRLENPGQIPLELIEVQAGSYLGEDDIVRFDDMYGRIKQ